MLVHKICCLLTTFTGLWDKLETTNSICLFGKDIGLNLNNIIDLFWCLNQLNLTDPDYKIKWAYY